jgi:lysophospholipase L1-like esterase
MIVVISSALGQALGRELELSHERFDAIKAAIRQPQASVIVFGDSIVEGAPLPEMLCGHAVVNGGVTGSTVEYFERHAAELLGSARPKLIVLAVGINNASPMAAKHFRAHYYKTVTISSRTAAVALATITPVMEGNGSKSYSAELVPVLKIRSSRCRTSKG